VTVQAHPTPLREPVRGASASTRLDSCVYLNPPSDGAIAAYLATGWQAMIGSSQRVDVGAYAGIPNGFLPNPHLPSPLGDYRPEALAVAGLPGSDLAETSANHIERERLSGVLLVHDRLMRTPAISHDRFTVALARAVNDWTADQLLGKEDRLRAALLVPTQLPEQAAAEIRRLGGDPRFASVLLGANGLGRPFGHGIYRPIFAAAAEQGLPVILHAGADLSTDALPHPIAGGPPATYTDHHVLANQSLATNLASIIGQGLFDDFPDLRILALGGGITWVTPFLWRFETDYRYLRLDAPWLKRHTIEYFFESVRVGTHPLEDAPGLSEYLCVQDGLESLICYASGYPRADADSVDDVRRALPSGWAARALGDNAEALLGRWAPAEPRSASRTACACDEEQRL
jgi:predicted TIM-barrel fold metal-dependent hydrolase